MLRSRFRAKLKTSFDASDLTNGTLILDMASIEPDASIDMTFIAQTAAYTQWANDTTGPAGLYGYYKVKG